ncbi:MAG: TolC family protein [Spirochaetes bacterium]|nr:TolC family protein [Spirochaetota bacterium]
MRYTLAVLMASVMVVLLMAVRPVLAQETVPAGGTDAGGAVAEERREGFAGKLQGDRKLRLTVDRVVDYLIKNNLDVRATLLEYRGVSTGLEKYQSRYDTTLFGKADYTYFKNPNSSSAILYGNESHKGTWTAGVRRQFDTGTTIEAGLTGYSAVVSGAYFGGSGGNQTGLSLSVTQELLKNAFGVNDRLTEQKIANSTARGKQLLKMKLSGLLVQALVGYWQIAIAEENVATMDISVKSAQDIRNLVADKSRLGLSEPEEVYDWNNKVLQLKNAQEQAQLYLFQARLALLRTLNMDAGLEIELGQTFVTAPPAVTEAQALGDALLRRMDLEGQRIELKNAELEYRIASQNVTPSLKLKVQASNLDYSARSPLYTLDTINQQFYAGLEFAYPLGNTEAGVRLREARLNYQQQYVAMEALERGIRDEIATSVRACETAFRVYEQSKQSNRYARNYYNQVVAKFRRGRYNTLMVKQALDDYTKARYNELNSLVQYNVALIQRDHARNAIFSNLGIEIDDILRAYEK